MGVRIEDLERDAPVVLPWLSCQEAFVLGCMVARVAGDNGWNGEIDELDSYFGGRSEPKAPPVDVRKAAGTELACLEYLRPFLPSGWAVPLCCKVTHFSKQSQKQIQLKQKLTKKK